MAQRDLFRSPPPAWNAKRIVGAKPPLKPKHVWAIRQQLRANDRVRDLALFDCGIDAKLRGCDLVKFRLSDVAPGGMLRQRATVIQQKTGRPVPFEISEPTREALTAWLALRGRRVDGRERPVIWSEANGRSWRVLAPGVALVARLRRDPRLSGPQRLEPEPSCATRRRGA